MSWVKEDDEWDLINNDGFVYKLNKRHRLRIPPSSCKIVSNGREEVFSVSRKWFDQLEISQDDALTVKLQNLSRCSIIDDILTQVEAQEAMMDNVSDLCEATEALCDVVEERSKQFFLDLPVWALSAHELMNTLCDGCSPLTTGSG